jgi:hypothetical protein
MTRVPRDRYSRWLILFPPGFLRMEPVVSHGPAQTEERKAASREAFRQFSVGRFLN